MGDYHTVLNLGGTTWDTPAPQGVGVFVLCLEGGDRSD